MYGKIWLRNMYRKYAYKAWIGDKVCIKSLDN